MDIEEAAEERERQWIAEHGAHEWEKHDLVKEAKEEAVDGFAYCQAALAGHNGPLTGERREALLVASTYFEMVYRTLERL